jgi:uncharacterized membrane protein
MANPSTGVPEPRPSVYREVAGILALLALAVVLGVVDLLLQGQALSISSALAAWNWAFTVAIVIIVVVIAIWTVRLVSGTVGSDHRERRYERRRLRYGYGTPASGPDPAVQIARERYARGEISQEQLDNILRQLNKGT